MSEHILWLADVQDGPWKQLARWQREGLPVPNGFVITDEATESEIRAAYETLKFEQHTCFTAVRGHERSVLDVIGGDRLMQQVRRMLAECPGTVILVQAMVNGFWCGKATWENRNLRIFGCEGMARLDPDMYLFNTTSGKCTRRTLHQSPRKVFRGVDGTTKTMEISGARQPLLATQLQAIAELAKRAGANIVWVLDHRGVWLLG